MPPQSEISDIAFQPHLVIHLDHMVSVLEQQNCLLNVALFEGELLRRAFQSRSVWALLSVPVVALLFATVTSFIYC